MTLLASKTYPHSSSSFFWQNIRPCTSFILLLTVLSTACLQRDSRGFTVMQSSASIPTALRCTDAHYKRPEQAESFYRVVLASCYVEGLAISVTVAVAFVSPKVTRLCTLPELPESDELSVLPAKLAGITRSRRSFHLLASSLSSPHGAVSLSFHTSAPVRPFLSAQLSLALKTTATYTPHFLLTLFVRPHIVPPPVPGAISRLVKHAPASTCSLFKFCLLAHNGH